MIRTIRMRRVSALTRSVSLARLAAVVAMSGLSLGACDVHGVSDPGSLSSISVTPNPVTMTAGSTQQFAAVGKDFDGVALTTSPTWTVVGGGGTISSTGLFTAAATPGTFANTVKATSGGISGTATVTITVGPLASLTIAPTPVTLGVTATQQFTVVGKDAAGNIVPTTRA
jgi:hypothetical protein